MKTNFEIREGLLVIYFTFSDLFALKLPPVLVMKMQKEGCGISIRHVVPSQMLFGDLICVTMVE